MRFTNLRLRAGKKERKTFPKGGNSTGKMRKVVHGCKMISI